MLHRILNLFFPPRCVLCRKFLTRQQTDFCPDCRTNAPLFKKSEKKLSFIAGWTAVWYYKDEVRNSILRYKFSRKRHYAPAFGRMLAMKLQEETWDCFDTLTFVPVAPLRRFSRGYDQVELLTDAVAREMGTVPVRTLRKVRNTPPQSRLKDAARRRANVLGAYVAVNTDAIRGKRILLLDDIVTSGATASECARVLLTAGAKEVYCAALAAANHKM